MNMNITTYTKESLHSFINAVNMIYSQIMNNLKVNKIYIMIL